MAMGWGVRGAYGHSTGAAMPGALVSLVICLCAHRPDWWRRTAVFGFLGYLGWAFGGQASYGIIVGYTSGTSFPNVYYGYAHGSQRGEVCLVWDEPGECSKRDKRYEQGGSLFHSVSR